MDKVTQTVPRHNLKHVIGKTSEAAVINAVSKSPKINGGHKGSTLLPFLF